VNASGIGLAGVTVTLSGTQSATAVTDSNGKFVFNLISISGSHTVTPSSGGLTFFPANRTFTNPTWNQSATFIAAGGANASDPSVFFVTQHYNDFLNREPDAAGLAFWVNEIEQCGADAQCREIKRINVSAAFYLAIEFKETGYLVYRAYKTAFGNLPGKPVPVTFAQLMNDTQRVGRNVRVGIGDWQAVLEANQRAFFNGLVQRPEFLARFPTSMSPEAFVDALNANADGQLSDQRADLVAQLTADNTTAGRAAVVRRAAGDSSLFDAEFNKGFVLMQYFGYLRRNPDSSPDTDFRGWQFWFDKLNEFNGNFVNAEMVKAFITSIEYRNRFGQ
jgi:hypothetical protein